MNTTTKKRSISAMADLIGKLPLDAAQLDGEVKAANERIAKAAEVEASRDALAEAHAQMAKDGCPAIALRKPGERPAPLANGTKLPRSAPGRELAVPAKTPQTKKEQETMAKKLGLTVNGGARHTGKQATKSAPSKAKAVKAPSGKTKAEMIGELLKRKSGCTTADVLAATGWPAVSMPQQATQLGLKLRKEKKPGEVTRYFAI
jgi:hypothetical protein